MERALWEACLPGLRCAECKEGQDGFCLGTSMLGLKTFVVDSRPPVDEALEASGFIAPGSGRALRRLLGETGSCIAGSVAGRVCLPSASAGRTMTILVPDEERDRAGRAALVTYFVDSQGYANVTPVVSKGVRGGVSTLFRPPTREGQDGFCVQVAEYPVGESRLVDCQVCMSRNTLECVCLFGNRLVVPFPFITVGHGRVVERDGSQLWMSHGRRDEHFFACQPRAVFTISEETDSMREGQLSGYVLEGTDLWEDSSSEQESMQGREADDRSERSETLVSSP
ncbi:uncharacterized protein B0I36DRAFT_316314 [Microdochium trichocladiopsis]|uniref:Uncharacterized protein n=1 Tax=Microdochium trichocladiopsis TaxID=1682393 RepID=A0A9P9BVA2_9PEZI|nr:uncharacterized protein B0I36DRAFT_316314 [Microdochium trichocladiopsis]KAH7038456.1 hypothetical protein B0I36DRAFT_316314 [Microdochium trichocladiopsis]